MPTNGETNPNNMENKNDTGVSPEELEAEQEALKEAREDEVRENVISEYGFSEDDDAEKIDKLVEERMTAHETKRSLTRQKANWREKASKKDEQPPKPKEEDKPNPEDFDEKVQGKVLSILEQRDLDALEYSDELKAEIKKIAQVNKVSVKKALQDPYIQFKVEEYEKEQKTEEATLSRKSSRTGGKTSFSVDNPPDVDMATEEGQKKWDEYLGWLKQQQGFREGDAQL